MRSKPAHLGKTPQNEQALLAIIGAQAPQLVWHDHSVCNSTEMLCCQKFGMIRNAVVMQQSEERWLAMMLASSADVSHMQVVVGKVDVQR